MAARYWIGGTGTWSSSNTANWSTSSGGSGGASVPGAGDDVFIDANSGGGTITLANSQRICRSLDFTGFNGTFSLAATLGIYGSLTLVSGMTLSGASLITFMATSGSWTITTAGLTFAGSVTIGSASSTATWTLQDSWTFGTSNTTLSLAKGTLDTNGQTITVNTFNYSSSSSNTRTLTLGSSIINIATSFTYTSTSGFTLNVGTSSIRLTSTASFAGAGLTWYELQLNGTSHTVQGTNTFTTFTRTGTTAKTCSLSLSNNQTITGTLTLTGNSNVSRLLVQSDIEGTTRTLTSANNAITNSDFQDITGAGAGSWNLAGATGGSGDCGGNSGITFTSPASWYWYNNAGNVSDYTKLYSATNGGGTQMDSSRSILAQDTLYIDVNSANTVSQVITIDMPRVGTIDCTGHTYSSRLSVTNGYRCYGSLIYVSAMGNFSNSGFTYSGRGSHQIQNGGNNISSFNINTYGGIYTLTVSSLLASNTCTLTQGTLDFNDSSFSITALRFDNSNTKVLYLGNGTITISGGGGSPWNASIAGTTLYPEGSTIKFTANTSSNSTFAGSGLIYNNIWNATSGTGKLVITGSNTFNDFKSDAGRTINFTAGTTTTVTTFTAVGTSGNNIVIASVTSATHTLSCASGTIDCDYLTISYSVATGGATWNAGSHSTDGGNNTGWIFGGSSGIKKALGLSYASIKKINGVAIASVKKYMGVT